MARIEITQEELIVHIEGWDKLLTLRSSLRIPLANVVGVQVRPADAHFDGMKGIKLAGGHWPHSFAAGYFWITGSDDEPRLGALDGLENATVVLGISAPDPTGAWAKAAALTEQALAQTRKAIAEQNRPQRVRYIAFYDVHDPNATIGVDLDHQSCKRLVLQVTGETPEEVAGRISAAAKLSVT
jgi:hypothetical protein